jgi:hypothetical protein
MVQPLRRHKHRALTALSIYAACLTASVVSLAVYRFPRPSIEVSPDPAHEAAGPDIRHTGTVLIPREIGGGCRRLRFDSHSGTIAEVGVVACPNGAPEPNTTGDRMGSIRNAFSRK